MRGGERGLSVNAVSGLVEIAFVPVRRNDVSRFVINANLCRMRAAEKARIINGIGNCAGLAVPQSAERQNRGDQIVASVVVCSSERCSLETGRERRTGRARAWQLNYALHYAGDIARLMETFV